jgi:hypothetical protein
LEIEVIDFSENDIDQMIVKINPKIKIIVSQKIAEFLKEINN